MSELRSAEFESPITLEVQPFTTPEGATFEPWTDGSAVGFKVTAPNLPDRYILLNPSTATSTGDVYDTDVFLYDGEGEPELEHPVCYYNIWDRPEEG